MSRNYVAPRIGDHDAVLRDPAATFVTQITQVVVPDLEVGTPHPCAHSLEREALAFACSQYLLASEAVAGPLANSCA
jgi:hypothetical protein